MHDDDYDDDDYDDDDDEDVFVEDCSKLRDVYERLGVAEDALWCAVCNVCGSCCHDGNGATIYASTCTPCFTWAGGFGVLA